MWRARYPCVKVSVYEVRSTKCVRQCCHIEVCCFFAYPPSSEKGETFLDFLPLDVYTYVVTAC